jgi:hypothetical protein
MRSIDAPILIDILRRTLPEGVELSVHQHQEEHYEARYIPGEGIKLLFCKKEGGAFKFRHTLFPHIVSAAKNQFQENIELDTLRKCSSKNIN